MFSDYFIGVEESIVSTQIDFSSCRMHKRYFLPSEGTSIFLAPVSLAEFHKATKNTESVNSVGYRCFRKYCF